MFKFQISIYFLLVSIFLVYNAVFFNLFSYKQANFDTENNKFEPPVAQNSAIINGRLILVLIDALRYDFIFESNVAKEKLRMPFVNRVIREQKAIPFKLIANPPTVTLPRLKALVSGIIPEFIDILWNFNTTYLAEDNIIRQFNLQNSPVIFYGDDTWLKLFRPNESFVRYEGTTSFMASDYDQVDFNVTRHLAFELEQTDWKVMILHYLGLDHVGHIEGPYAPFNIRRKLHEMDEIIKKIYSNLNRNDLMLVLSDHGMANEGGHGGSSHMEITTPLLLLSKGLFGSKFTYADDQKFNSLIENIKEKKQIDLVSTLSCLFGLNVPYHNKGTVFLSDLTEYFDKSLRNYSLEANCLVRNWKQLDRLLDLGQHEIELVRMLDKKSLADAEEFLKIKVESKVKVENIKSEQNKFLILLILIMFMLLFVYAIDQSNSRPFTNPFSCLLALLIFLSKQTFIKALLFTF
ncbi:GPI ethanolamine phosphate transferase 2 [Brachionus plicatilis]|uniref:GPI ethanolamine phosphate transferase 2 n=1 Tax=Brachionus plicatilis TaxID=10195 RepID=A0A3M7TA22_BRAPC|nr:GPI ethanolamine phosphate transferase 2 [Brachionus plicatilis]